MAINTLAAVCIIFYYIAILFVGVWAGRKVHADKILAQAKGVPRDKKSKKEDDSVDNFLLRFFVANRCLPLAIGFASMTATWVGGGIINRTAEVIYTRGLVYCNVPLGYMASLCIGGWLFAGKMRATDSLTMLDPFQKHYGCWMGVLLSLPAVSGELCWTASILYALGSTVETIVSIHAGLSIVVSAVVILFYTSLGGLFSVVYCDSFQIICTTVGLWTCVPFILANKAVGQIGSVQGDWVGRIQFMDVPQLLDISAMTVFGGIPWQVYFQRVLSCKSVVNAKLLSYFTAMACLFLTIPAALIGAASKTANFTAAGYPGPAVLEDSGAVIGSAIRYMTPNTVSILGLAAITSAILSSADSSMLSASTMITQNIYRMTLRPRATVLEIGLVLRLAIWFMGALATVMALYVNSVSEFWALSSDAVYVLLFPQLVGVFYARKRTNSYGSFIGFSVGALFRALCGEPLVNIPAILKLPMYDERLGQQFPFRTLCMVLSFVTLIVTSHVAKRLFTKGTLPQKYDVCCCFTPAATKDTADKDEKEDDPSKGGKRNSRKKPCRVPRTKAPSMFEIQEDAGEALPSAVSTASQKTDVAGISETTAAPQEEVADGSQQNDVGKVSKEEVAGTSKKAAGHNKKKKYNRKDKSKKDSLASSAKETATSDKEGADSLG